MKTAKRTAKRRRTSDAVKILQQAITKEPALVREVDIARVNARVAELIYESRTEAGLTQRELAALVGTKQPVIARLEDGEYDGHSLSMLQKIAAALHRNVEIRMPLVSCSAYSVQGRKWQAAPNMAVQPTGVEVAGNRR